MAILFGALEHSARYRRSDGLLRLLGCLICGSVSLVSLVHAETANSVLTLDVALKRSVARNPSLQVFDFQNTALDGELATADLRPGYSLNVAAENFLGADEFQGLDTVELTISISSVLELGDKRAARRGIVSSRRAMLDAERQVASLDVLGDVTRRYVDVLAAQEQLLLAREANQLAADALTIVGKRAKAGAAPDADVKRAEAAAAQATLTLLSAQRQLDYLKVSLAAFWGETSPDFAGVAGDLYRFGDDAGFDALFAKVEQAPAIEVFATASRLREAEVRVARTQAKADISWTLGARRFQESSNTALVAGFSVPLFGGTRSAGSVSAAVARRHEIAAQRDVAMLNMHTQLYRAFHNRQQAMLTVRELRATIIPSLAEALAQTETAYERGRYSYLEYVSARQELLGARRSLIESAAAVLLYGAEIEQLTAQPLSPQTQSPPDRSSPNRSSPDQSPPNQLSPKGPSANQAPENLLPESLTSEMPFGNTASTQVVFIDAAQLRAAASNVRPAESTTGPVSLPAASEASGEVRREVSGARANEHTGFQQ